MDNLESVITRLDSLEAKLDAVYVSVERMRTYFTVMLWVTVAMVVLPAIALVVVIPRFISTYVGTLEGFL